MSHDPMTPEDRALVDSWLQGMGLTPTEEPKPYTAIWHKRSTYALRGPEVAYLYLDEAAPSNDIISDISIGPKTLTALQEWLRHHMRPYDRDP